MRSGDMKQVQVKAELVENEHEALNDFYNIYPKLFANKVLLALAERCLDEYPPTLANFETKQGEKARVVRSVVLRIDPEMFPKLWAFYKDLPFGSKTMVLVNVLNGYAQLAEADRSILEDAFWGSGNRPKPSPVESNVTALVKRQDQTKDAVLPDDRPVETKPAEAPPDKETEDVMGESDPLLDFVVQL